MSDGSRLLVLVSWCFVALIALCFAAVGFGYLFHVGWNMYAPHPADLTNTAISAPTNSN